jgi:hypothetical protein
MVESFFQQHLPIISRCKQSPQSRESSRHIVEEEKDSDGRLVREEVIAMEVWDIGEMYEI